MSYIKQKIFRNKIFKSMRFRALAFVLILTVIPPVILEFGLAANVENSMVRQKMDRLQGQCNILRNNLVSLGYLDMTDSEDMSAIAINAELSQLSGMYDGRILIVDSDFKIINDTYQMDEGKTCISSSVIKCFAGKNISEYSSKDEYIEITLPITSSGSDNISGVMLVDFSTKEISEAMVGFRTRASLIELVIFVVSVVLAIIWSKSLVRPFRKLNQP